jgi:hypothetical protein
MDPKSRVASTIDKALEYPSTAVRQSAHLSLEPLMIRNIVAPLVLLVPLAVAAPASAQPASKAAKAARVKLRPRADFNVMAYARSHARDGLWARAVVVYREGDAAIKDLVIERLQDKLGKTTLLGQIVIDQFDGSPALEIENLAWWGTDLKLTVTAASELVPGKEVVQKTLSCQLPADAANASAVKCVVSRASR